jgi:hypothetical protein
MNGGGKYVDKEVELLMSQTYIVIGLVSLSYIYVKLYIIVLFIWTIIFGKLGTKNFGGVL